MFFYSLFFYFVIFCISQKIIELPVEITNFETIELNLDIGNPRKKYAFHLSTITQKIYVTDDINYCSKNSLTYQKIECTIPLPFIGEKIKGCLSQESFYFSKKDNQFLPHQKFILINQGNVQYDNKGVIGFEYLISKNNDDNVNVDSPKEFSLFEQMYQEVLIFKKIFSISQNIFHDDINLVLRIGDYPKQFNTKKSRYKKCCLIENDKFGRKNSQWQCNLNGVYTSDELFYPIQAPVTFSLGGNVITVDIGFFDIIQKKYFEKAEREGTCQLIRDKPLGSKKISCTNSFARNFDNIISFILGKFNIKVSGNDLWINDTFGRKTFRLIYFPDKKYEWAINFTSLKNKYTMIFDKDRGEVGFFLK